VSGPIYYNRNYPKDCWLIEPVNPAAYAVDCSDGCVRRYVVYFKDKVEHPDAWMVPMGLDPSRTKRSRRKSPRTSQKKVRVVKTDDRSSGVPLDGFGPAWLVKSWTPQTWWFGTRRSRRRYGPILDADLQPIRGIGRPAIVISTSIRDPGIIINLTDPLSVVPHHRRKPLD